MLVALSLVIEEDRGKQRCCLPFYLCNLMLVVATARNGEWALGDYDVRSTCSGEA